MLQMADALGQETSEQPYRPVSGSKCKNICDHSGL